MVRFSRCLTARGHNPVAGLCQFATRSSTTCGIHAGPGPEFPSQEHVAGSRGPDGVPVPGVENVDLSAVVRAHTDYAANMPVILDILGLAGPDA